ncbi:non-ribosomal peptide synthetase [Paenibacillus caseinilyticus]|uniref:FusA protein n=1 Tax=Paenibacillus mucilaginosus K02 TaxID=997761 RepID=I0BKY1_9BACL|nr:non-ribosomal peptide synthetase [Paenibacillus mucilaginosus]AFH63028.2 FusA protein [Paenibacillus mucilaginosus K02]
MPYATLVDMLEAAGGRSDRGITFIAGEKETDRRTYKELFGDALRVLGHLQRKGVRTGDEVVLMADEPRHFVEGLWACLLGGFIPVPVSPGTSREHRRKLFGVWPKLVRPHLLTEARVQRMLSHQAPMLGLKEAFDAMLPNTLLIDGLRDEPASGRIHRPAPQELALIQYSSGSTGEPKGVMLTHENLLSNIDGILDSDPQRWAEDTFLSWMPLTHDLGLIGFHLTPAAAGLDQCLMPTPLFVRSPLFWLQAAVEHQATVLASPNFGLSYFLEFYAPEKGLNWDLSVIRKIVNGAEPIMPEVCRRFLEALKGRGLASDVMVPAYGLAEASVGVTLPAVDGALHVITADRTSLSIGSEVRLLDEEAEGTLSFVSLGAPIRGVELRICGEDGRPLGELQVGHIRIRGRNVTRGYYRNPEATEKLLCGDGWIETGDLGFLHRGRLVVTGRMKEVLMVNGQNIYAHDLEQVAGEIEGIGFGRLAACGARKPGASREEVLLFAAVRTEPAKFAALAEAIRSHVRVQMGVDIDRIIPVQVLPKTTSGKIQRGTLARRYELGEFDEALAALEVEAEAVTSAVPTVRPANQTEEDLLHLWQELLGRDGFGTGDDFFELGGQSLKAGMLAARIHPRFGVELTLDDMYRLRTVREQAAYIREAERTAFTPITPAAPGARIPATSVQQRLFVLQHQEGVGTAYNVTYAAWLEGDLDRNRLEAAWSSLIRQTALLRTSFSFDDTAVVQRVAEEVEFEVERLPGVSSEELPEAVRAFIRPFDLGRGPLLRVALLTAEDGRHLLLVDAHHAIVDRSSMILLLEQWTRLYNGGTLRKPDVEFKDYAVWLSGQLSSGLLEKAGTYWTEELAGELPVLQLPTDRARQAMQQFRGDEVQLELGTEEARGIRRLAAESGTTPFAVLFSAYQALLYRYTAQTDLIVGVPAAGRTHADLAEMPGMFVNTLPIRCTPQGEAEFARLVRETDGRLRSAFSHQHYPLEKLLERLQVPRDTGRNPLFDTVFVMQNMDETPLAPAGLRVVPYALPCDHAKFDLTVEVLEAGEGYRIHLQYALALFDRATVERMGAHFLQLLRDAMAHPGKRLDELALLDPAEAELLANRWNRTPGEVPEGQTLHGLFEKQAALAPDAVALLSDEGELTYRQLQERTDILAARLRAEGLGPGRFVGVLAERSIGMVCAALAVMKAGAAYVPLDVSLPESRLRTIAAALDMGALVVSAAYGGQALALLQASPFMRCLLDADRGTVTGRQAAAGGADGTQSARSAGTEQLPAREARPEDPAYAIFTSGSTGTPKGVVVAHRPVVNLITWVNETFGVGPRDRVLFVTSLSFDLSVYDIFGLLAAGGSVRIVAEQDLRSPQRLLAMLKEEPVTLWDSAPAALAQLEPFFPEAAPASSRLRLVLLSGDWIPLTLPTAVRRVFPGARVVALGGATEAAVWSNFHEVGEIDPEWTSIPYGRPIRGARYYVLDSRRQLCPVGVPGELYIGGECLADGYAGDPALTEERFVSDPYGLYPGARMYRTGDRARWRSEGWLEFLGRADHQVKIRGYRIETGEIQAALLSHPEITAAAVTARDHGAGERTLCAYLVSDRDMPVMELREFLAGRLPGYMIPSHFVRLDAMPVTANGKLDLKALPAPPAEVRTGAPYEGPRSAAEELLVRLWQEVLQLEKVSIHDPFFSLGGDSIKAIQVMSRLHRHGLRLEVRDFFQYPTIAQLSPRLQADTAEIPQEEITGESALTPVQMWFFEQLGREAHFNQAMMLYRREGFREEIVREVFTTLLRHHDALRLVFPGGAAGTSDIQAVHRPAEEEGFTLERFDWTEMNGLPGGKSSESNGEASGNLGLESRMEAECTRIQKGMNLEKGPLVRLGLFHTQEGDHLLIAVHHLVIDGVSWRILLDDFAVLHDALLQGGEAAAERLPSKTHPFRDWAAGLQRIADSPELLQEKPYWHEVENGPHFPIPAEADTGLSGSRSIHAAWSKETTAALADEAHRVYNADVEVMLLTALGLAAEETFGLLSLLVQMEGHGREGLPELNVSRTIGWFTAMYPLVLEADRAGDLGYRIKSVKEKLRRVPGRGTGWQLLKYLTPAACKMDSSFTLKPEISFNYLGEFGEELGSTGMVISRMPAGRTGSAASSLLYGWNLNAYIRRGELQLLLEYDAGKYGEAAMKRLASSMERNVYRLLEHCSGMSRAEATPSDFIYNEWDLDEYDQFLKEMAADLTLE